MASISLCMIMRNEEETIERCLQSVEPLVDEIIMVDTGSTDQTKEIVQKYTDRVYDFVWIDDFSAARNYSFQLATQDYILWLDADDVLSEEDQVKLRKLKQTIDSSVDSVTMIYHYAFDEFGNPTVRFRRNRLVKRAKQFQWQGAVHEYLSVSGKIINSDLVVTHKRIDRLSNRNLSIYEKRLANSEKFTPRDLFYYANELKDHGKLHAAAEYYQRFLYEGEGWVEDNISACDKLADLYSQLGEIDREREFILKSFQYDTPRAELCCRMGYSYLREKDYQRATFWYELATRLDQPTDSWGFFNESCWTWLPQLQLCVCYYYLSDYKKSYESNELARCYRPLDEHVLHNKKLLETILDKVDSAANPKPLSQNRPLRIVQIAPDIYPVPPENYGGIERIVYDLTEQLVHHGHEVYVYAPKGSRTSGTLIPYEHEGIWQQDSITTRVMTTLPEHIDLIHDHTHYSIFGKANLSIPTVCTIHIPVNNSVKYPVYVSKKALELFGGNYGFYVYNGIYPEMYEFSEQKDNYLFFLGRLDEVKGLHHVLDVAEQTDQRLIVAGPVFDHEHFTKVLKPRMDRNPKVEYVGEVGGKRKQELLKKARCLLFPTTFEEPFGLVMIEAMTCGTPVLALGNGAVPEVLSGFPECICQSVDEMVEKVRCLSFPTPQSLRDYVTGRFTIQQMTDQYLSVYEKVISDQHASRCK